MTQTILPLFAFLSLVSAASAQKPYAVGADVSAPIPTVRQEPEYTEAARAARIVGSVYLTLVVDETGVPAEIKVERWALKKKRGGKPVSDPMGLDEAAVRAVSGWRFQPARKDGKPVPARAKVEINFKQ